MPAFAAIDDVYDVMLLENASRRRKYSVSRSGVQNRKRYGTPTCQRMRFTDTNHGSNPALDNIQATPLSRSTTPTSKSFRATNRLARRARSFKEDFLEKISQMRNTATAPVAAVGGVANCMTATPMENSKVGGPWDNNRVGVSRSGRDTPTDCIGRLSDGDKGGIAKVGEFDLLTKQLQTALMYFRSSVANDKLEMLAGNGTIILDTVWAINLAVKSACTTTGLQSCDNEMATKVKMATKAMYQNASRLIKVCDDALLEQSDDVTDDKPNEKADEERRVKKKLYRDSVEDVLVSLEESVKSLLRTAFDAQGQLHTQPSHAHRHHKTTPRNSSTHHKHNLNNNNNNNTVPQQQQHNLLHAPSSNNQQRNSLPDIPLTPHERELLEKTAAVREREREAGDCPDGRGQVKCDVGVVNGGRGGGASFLLGKNSYSSESVLREVEGVAPPKPPLPKSMALRSILMGGCASPPPLPPKKSKPAKLAFTDISYIDGITYNLERSSVRSRSPEDSISLLSASAGSLDSMLNHSREEEEIKSLMDHTDSDTVLENDISDAFATSQNNTSASMMTSASHNSSSTSHQMTHQACGNRLSNTDSGVVSLHSLRNSSCSKRSSVTSSSSNAIKHVELSNNESIVRTSSVETESSSHMTSHSHTYSHFTNSSVTSSTVNSSSTNSSNSSSTISMLSSSNNHNNNQVHVLNQRENNMQHCRLDSAATTTDDDDLDYFLTGKSVDLDDDVIVTDDRRLTEGDKSDNQPPALPLKMRKMVKERMPSPYDNIANEQSGDFVVTCQMHQSHQSLSSSMSMTSSISQDNGKPPPLPPKKKHMFQSVAYSVMAYMEMFGNCSHANDEFMRHSVHMMAGPPTMAAAAAQMSTTQSCSFSAQNSTWRSQVHQLSMDSNPSPPTNHPSSFPHTHPPPLSSKSHHHPHFTSTPCAVTPTATQQTALPPPALPPKRMRAASSSLATPPHSPTPPGLMATLSQSQPTCGVENDRDVMQEVEREGGKEGDSVTDDVLVEGDDVAVATLAEKQCAQLPDLLEHTVVGDDKLQQKDSSVTSSNSGTEEKWRKDLMEATEVDKYLVLKKADEDMPDIRGGSIDALIIQASMATRNSEEKENGFSYQEAFLTTYRTFITPYDLITKLIRRYYFFYKQTDKKKRFREAFALIVCVVNDLVSSDLDTNLHKTLMDFDQSLIADGELVLAKALRIKLLEKHDSKQQNKLIFSTQNASNATTTTILGTSPNISLPFSKGAPTLLDFKSEQIAEQMTLLDADLFMKIEIPEVLIWVQEQKEDTSPNLTRFTEHFNKMSYWARTRILQSEARDREKYFVKFIKIMKQLRKINNFNSYLALLSALDSAPIRRLEWQRQVQDGLKEYCALIDSSSSFRAYRQALAETSPPCIPYIGLVLQDLTFVHIGNNNLLPSGAINFSKRWQQFHIVENMKRFKKCSYNFKRHDRIISYFQNFNDYINEDDMWSISEQIKPRGKKAVQ